MAMTAAVKSEISQLPVTRTCCRKAEVSAVLRFAGGLHLVSGRIVIEAELDVSFAARRLKKDILEIFGHHSELVVMAPSGLRRGSRYLVRVVAGGDQLARQTGLVDGRGRPIRGLPPQVVSGATCDAEAAWRGAFLAHGSLTEPGRSSSLEVTCPGPEAALALVGAALSGLAAANPAPVPVPGGVTGDISPKGSPPPTCSEDYSGNFEITVVKPAVAKRGLEKVSFTLCFDF